MTQAKQRFSNFEEYLGYDDGSNNRYELIDGELALLPPESEPNDFIANYLMVALFSRGVAPLRLIRPGKCELQVPVLKLGDAANRYPDLVILDEIHLGLTQRRLTITLDMPAPPLVVEVISPGNANRKRDTIRKRDQYAARGIPEFWLIDPEVQTVTVLKLDNGIYIDVGVFQDNSPIVSPSYGSLSLTAGELMRAGA